MTELPQPNEAAEAEAIAIDLAIDALADRRQSTNDPALAALAGFARAIDRQAAALTIEPAPTLPRPSTPPSSSTGQTAPRGERPIPAGPGRSRLRRRLFAVPMAAALALGVAGPLSTSTGVSLHSLHRLVLQQLSPVDSARLSLVSAEQALDHASDESRARATDLDCARNHLAEARRQLALVTEGASRFQLITKLASLEHRAAQLAEAEAQLSWPLPGGLVGGGPTPAPQASSSGQDGSDKGDNGKDKNKGKGKDDGSAGQ